MASNLPEDTIIGASWEPQTRLRSMLTGAQTTELAENEVELRMFKIRAADTAGRRSSASILISRRYAWRGYQTKPLDDADDLNSITLVASDQDVTMGTISVGFDSADGLLVEEIFGEEVARMREAGHRLCEFTKLAMDTSRHSKRVLASLFHVAYIYAHRVRSCDRLLIEVNPRHVRYYEKNFGFEVMTSERLNTRVNAPAVLLVLDFAQLAQQIAMFGGQPETSQRERSSFPYWFSVAEEAGIFARLKNPHPPAKPPA